MLTDNPDDPRLGHGADEQPGPQNPVYLVLSEAERARGFVRPVRSGYLHVGEAPKYALRDLTPDELERYKEFGYVKFEAYPEGTGILGTYWTQARLDRRGCGARTTMALPLAETYAREPRFYGATYCCHCMMHRPVAEFVWDDGTRVGS